MPKEFRENIFQHQVLTPDGFKDFAGISLMKVDKIYRVELQDELWVECSETHGIYISCTEKKPANELIPCVDSVLTTEGAKLVVSVYDTGRVEELYDLIDVADGSRYYTNGIVSSNCQFVTFEETLINPVKLGNLTSAPPLFNTGQVRWFGPIERDRIYVIGLDPSMGTGGDNAAIQVLELPTLKQVAEWQSNKSPIEEQIRTMLAILEEIKSHGNPEVYWSVENNTLGEAALVVIREYGEERFPGTMLSDPTNRTPGRRRMGFTTTNKSKLETCAKLKTLIETGKLTIFSKMLISELKTFISKSHSYEAKAGQTDDLIMALVLVLRMVSFISTWDDITQRAYSSTTPLSGNDDDSYDSPMPLII